MDWLKEALTTTDFSQEVDLKERLAAKLFSEDAKRTSDEELEMLAAAGNAQNLETYFEIVKNHINNKQ